MIVVSANRRKEMSIKKGNVKEKRSHLSEAEGRSEVFNPSTFGIKMLQELSGTDNTQTHEYTVL